MGRTIAVMRKRHDRDELRRLLKQREGEGLTFKQLAERSGVPVHVLHHRAQQDARVARAKPAEEQGFVEVSASPDSRPSGIELHLAQGLRIHVARDFDGGTLVRLLAVVPC